MKLRLVVCVLSLALSGVVSSLAADVMKGGPAKAAPLHKTFSLKTASFTLDFEVGDDGRLYQTPIGVTSADRKPQRIDEAYPQAGDGYIYEPAIQVVHADGNTSTALLFEGVTRTNEADGRELMRIQLRDPAYPFEVALCFRAQRDRDVVEQWTEICHQESGPVTLERMASASPAFSTNIFLTHFAGDWAKEMLPTRDTANELHMNKEL